jgi:hypothetical protein
MVVSNARADAISVVDQQNSGPFTGTQGGVVFGQSFTPTLSRSVFSKLKLQISEQSLRFKFSTAYPALTG